MKSLAEGFRDAMLADPALRAAIDRAIARPNPWLERLKEHNRLLASADSDAKTLPPPKFWPGYLHSYDGYAAPAPAPVKAAPARCECGSNEVNCHSDWCPLSCR